jgi:integrase
LAQYNKAHMAACERIGLPVAKTLGTTPHGHRHAYGRRLKNAGVDMSLIRRFMHHASPVSQEIYTQATAKEAMMALEAGAQRLRESLGGQNGRFSR